MKKTILIGAVALGLLGLLAWNGGGRDVPVRSDVPNLSASAKFDAEKGITVTGYLVKSCPQGHEHHARVYIQGASESTHATMQWTGNDLRQVFSATEKPEFISIGAESCVPSHPALGPE